jgi:hypothetical protein
MILFIGGFQDRIGYANIYIFLFIYFYIYLVQNINTSIMISYKSELLIRSSTRTNRLLSFDATRTAQKTKCSRIILLRENFLPR